jgi:hypothetical protein
MEQKEKQTQEKKVYVKPAITRVELVAEEAVLSACKNGARGSCEPSLTCVTMPGS